MGPDGVDDLHHRQVPAPLLRQAAPQEQGIRFQGGRVTPFQHEVEVTTREGRIE